MTVRAALRVETVDADRLADHGPALGARLRSGQLTAAVVRGAVPADAARAAADHLDSGAHGLPETGLPEHFRATFYGRNLDLAEPDLVEYFALADRARPRIDGLVAGTDGGLVARCHEVLSHLADAGVSDATGADGERYLPASVKALRPGGFLPPHTEHECMERPPFARIVARIEPTSLMPWYLMLGAPERGGELRVYDLTWREVRAAGEREHERIHPGELVEGRAFVDVDLAPGDLVLHVGGRLVHEVRPVEGARTRWTVGGWLAQSSLAAGTAAPGSRPGARAPHWMWS